MAGTAVKGLFRRFSTDRITAAPDMWPLDGIDSFSGAAPRLSVKARCAVVDGSFSASKDEPFFGNADVGTRDPSDNNSGLCVVSACRRTPNFRKIHSRVMPPETLQRIYTAFSL